jgi:methylated-DNA-[protein]-cysteine S-methyltransferase
MGAEQTKTIFWRMVEDEGWRVPIAAGERGLLYVGAHGEPQEAMLAWIAKRYPSSELVHDPAGLARYAAELMEYWAGRRQAFTFAPDMQGTAFQRAVWQALLRIPYGATRTYSDIAAEIGRPAAVRAVGAAVEANPLLIVVPCHRVIGKNGALTGYRGGMAMKERLLGLESR